MKHKTFKIIKVPAKIYYDSFSVSKTCFSTDRKPCVYLNKRNTCQKHYETCYKEDIIYLKVETND